MTLQKTYNPRLLESIWWNLLLLTVGSLMAAIAVQAVAAPHGFLTGGLFGVALLIWYITDLFSASLWFLIISVPVSIWGWFYVGKRFLLYTTYGSVCTALFGILIDFQITIQDPLYAAIFVGVLTGTGWGIMLHSIGSGGGLDIVALALNEKWNFSIGKFSFIFNSILFSFALFIISLDMIIVSTILVFISSNVLEYVFSAFSQRKMVMIISGQGERICEAIIASEKFGATLIHAKGGYSGADREVLLTITNNVVLKRLESLVFNIDEKALFIVGNTFYVAGGQFARKKAVQ